MRTKTQRHQLNVVSKPGIPGALIRNRTRVVKPGESEDRQKDLSTECSLQGGSSRFDKDPRVQNSLPTKTEAVII